MFSRYLQLNQELDMSVFLLGARQTGKSTILRQQLPQAVFIDLLDSELRMRFQRRPSLLYDMMRRKSKDSIIVIGEITQFIRRAD